MKEKGVVRKIDDLGRITLPKGMRKRFELENKTSMEIISYEDGIFLKKYETSCIFCGGKAKLHPFEGKQVCADCFAKLKKTGAV